MFVSGVRRRHHHNHFNLHAYATYTCFHYECIWMCAAAARLQSEFDWQINIFINNGSILSMNSIMKR